jgi:hypothetical protein
MQSARETVRHYREWAQSARLLNGPPRAGFERLQAIPYEGFNRIPDRLVRTVSVLGNRNGMFS